MDPISILLQYSGIQENSMLVQYAIPMFYFLGLGGAVTGFFYYLYNQAQQKFQERYFAQIQVEGHNPLFKHLLTYFKDNGILDNAALSNLQATQLQTWRDRWEQSEGIQKNKSVNIEYTPGGNTRHMIKYKNTAIYLHHQEGEARVVGWENKVQKDHQLLLCCWGGAQKIELLKELCQVAADYSISRDDGKLRIYAIHEWGIGWKQVQIVKARPLDTVILDDCIADQILEDIQNFQKSRTWYEQRGVPYRRGYLLWGPPGTGKTSFIKAVAGKANLSICSLNLSGNQVDDDGLMYSLEKAPLNSIILLEDVDALFVQRTSAMQKGQSISFSGFLNALDGIRSQEGRIIFMTTNHKEKLDPALLRPGRADVKIQLNHASSNQIKRMFLRFFEGEEQMAEEFTQKVPESKLSMAKLQGHFLRYRDHPELAVRNVSELFDENVFLKEMSIGEWLNRLGCIRYYDIFRKKNINRLAELKFMTPDYLTEQKVKLIHEIRIMGMINGEKEIKDGFQFLSIYAVRQLLQMYIKDNSVIEQILQDIPENEVTEWQIREAILPTEKVLRKQSIQQRIQQQFQSHKLVLQGKAQEACNLLNQEVQNLVKKQQKQKLDLVDLFKIFSYHQCDKAFAKYKEKYGEDKEIFLTLSEDKLENELEIKKFGIRQKLMNNITALKTVLENEEKDVRDMNFDFIQQEQIIEEDLPEEIQLKKYLSHNLLKKKRSVII